MGSAIPGHHFRMQGVSLFPAMLVMEARGAATSTSRTMVRQRQWPQKGSIRLRDGGQPGIDGEDTTAASYHRGRAEPNAITLGGLFGIFLGHTFAVSDIVTETGREVVDEFPLEILSQPLVFWLRRSVRWRRRMRPET